MSANLSRLGLKRPGDFPNLVCTFAPLHQRFWLGACLSNAKSGASPTISCAWWQCESQYVAMKMITRTRSLGLDLCGSDNLQTPLLLPLRFLSVTALQCTFLSSDENEGAPVVGQVCHVKFNRYSKYRVLGRNTSINCWCAAGNLCSHGNRSRRRDMDLPIGQR